MHERRALSRGRVPRDFWSHESADVCAAFSWTVRASAPARSHGAIVAAMGVKIGASRAWHISRIGVVAGQTRSLVSSEPASAGGLSDEPGSGRTYAESRLARSATMRRRARERCCSCRPLKRPGCLCGVHAVESLLRKLEGTRLSWSQATPPNLREPALPIRCRPPSARVCDDRLPDLVAGLCPAPDGGVGDRPSPPPGGGSS